LNYQAQQREIVPAKWPYHPEAAPTATYRLQKKDLRLKIFFLFSFLFGLSTSEKRRQQQPPSGSA
jgi:hypothetical protein